LPRQKARSVMKMSLNIGTSVPFGSLPSLTSCSRQKTQIGCF
jgi:hypothetical protein